MDENKGRVAIVAVGYNRLNSITRLLDSLTKASYDCENVPLIISIDASGNQELYDKVNKFEWPYGDLYVNIQSERLGLKQHIFSCMDMSRHFRAVIILEDDIYVAPQFYNYTLAALAAYEHDSKVCGIALYSIARNGYVGLPFTPMHNGSDVYLHQDVCTWGECLTYSMWHPFRQWLEANESRTYEEIEMPLEIKQWKRAWSKYYYAYMLEHNKAFVTPYISYTTNFSDSGEHGDMTNVAQVPIQWGERREYSMQSSEHLVAYDAYYNNVALYAALGLKPEELTLDLYGNNDFYLSRRYVLTTRALPFKIEKEFNLSFYPIEVNVLQNVAGQGIRLYDTTTKCLCAKSEKLQYNYLKYYLGLNNHRLLLKYILEYCFRALCRRLKIKR
jgi:hypothetical protein